MLNIETTDSLPPVRRGGGRPSAERKQIQDALATLSTQVVRNVEAGNKYNALQQRIRQAAQQMGLKVKVVYRKSEDDQNIGDLYFVGMIDTPEVVVDDTDLNPKAKTVRNAVKSSDKTKV
jgi:hypothetical protein